MKESPPPELNENESRASPRQFTLRVKQPEDLLIKKDQEDKDVIEDGKAESIESVSPSSPIETEKATGSLMPRVNLAESAMTWTPPSNSSPSSGRVLSAPSEGSSRLGNGPTSPSAQASSSVSCFMWVHLQASICTEWEQCSMILTPGSHFGAKVAASVAKSATLSQVLEKAGPSASDKRPKTIHRCILQRASQNNSKANGVPSGSALTCHVCEASYPNYGLYIEHLLDSTCSRRKLPTSPTSPAANGRQSFQINDHQNQTTVNEVQIEAEIIRGRKRVVASSSSPYSSASSSPVEVTFEELNLESKRTRRSSHFIEDEDATDQASMQPINLSLSRSEKQRPGRLPPLDTNMPSLVPVIMHDSSPDGSEMTALTPTKESDDCSEEVSLCPHLAAATRKAIGLNEYVADQAILATLKVQLTTVMMGLLGEDRLTAMGYPDKDILQVLRGVLELASCRNKWYEINETCTGLCPRLEVSLPTNQVRFQTLRCELRVARQNIRQLIEICVPDPDVWRRNKWHGQPVEAILSKIISEESSLLLQN